MSNIEKEKAKGIIEALMIASSRSLTMQEIVSVLEEADEKFILDVIEDLKSDYLTSGRSFSIDQIAGGYRIVTNTEYGPWLKKLFKVYQTEKLTGASLETLAVIAYRQPATKAEIEAIRSVNVDGVIERLLEKNLIKIKGRKDAPGRPIVYGTTKEFLEYFGLNSLEELPKLEDFKVAIAQEDIKGPAEVEEKSEVVNEGINNEINQPSNEDRQDRPPDC